MNNRIITSANIASLAVLYEFDTFTFTNASQTGRIGASLANLLASYNTVVNPWLLDTAFYNSTNGIQLWTVPKTGTYTISAVGAKGGGTYRGYSRQHSGDFNLVAEQKIRILVGQDGISSGLSVSGGGGTFVMEEIGSLEENILIIAGGGGGAVFSYANAHSTFANNALSGYGASVTGAGGTNGSGGVETGRGGAGGGLLTSGGAISGAAFITGGLGGDSTYDGGFGGGGAAYQTGFRGAGGGGGYSGGGGGSTYNDTGATHAGGGGASYNNGENQYQGGVQAIAQVIITLNP